jgi:hypothetical protein
VRRSKYYRIHLNKPYHRPFYRVIFSVTDSKTGKIKSKCLSLKTVDYGEAKEIVDGIRARFKVNKEITGYNNYNVNKIDKVLSFLETL